MGNWEMGRRGDAGIAAHRLPARLKAAAQYDQVLRTEKCIAPSSAPLRVHQGCALHLGEKSAATPADLHCQLPTVN
jgi:hypothetical protein